MRQDTTGTTLPDGGFVTAEGYHGDNLHRTIRMPDGSFRHEKRDTGGEWHDSDVEGGYTEAGAKKRDASAVLLVSASANTTAHRVERIAWKFLAAFAVADVLGSIEYGFVAHSTPAWLLAQATAALVVGGSAVFFGRKP